jgi:hypothetical protein
MCTDICLITDIERKLLESQANGVLWDASKVPAKGSNLPPSGQTQDAAGAQAAKGSVKPGDKSDGDDGDVSDQDSKQKGLPASKKGQVDPRLLQLSLNFSYNTLVCPPAL